MAWRLCRHDRVVPVAMEGIPDDVKVGHAGIVDLDPARVRSRIEPGAQPQALRRVSSYLSPQSCS